MSTKGKKPKVQMTLFGALKQPKPAAFAGDSDYARVMRKFMSDPANEARYVVGDGKHEQLQREAKKKWNSIKPGARDENGLVLYANS